MTQTTPDKHCSDFLDRLDGWLAGETEADGMWEHHDSCEACRMQARLAREIGGILTALPELPGPEIRMPVASARPAHQSLVSQLLQAWRQPMVFIPAMAALLLASVLVPQVLVPQLPEGSTALEPELVVIDGQVYTREEILQATVDLEMALRYIDKYKPARVISAELDKESPQENTEQDSGDTAPTI